MNDYLFDRLCNLEVLHNAWQTVKSKNTSGGIDLKSVEDYSFNLSKNLKDLLISLEAGNYVPLPYKEVFIPKNTLEKRRLGLLTIEDKIVQTAVFQLITPIFEKVFLKVSYGYRSHYGALKAIRRVQHLITNEKYIWLASCDIRHFFDTIDQSILFQRLSVFLKSPKILHLIEMFVKMGSIGKKSNWIESNTGIPQGGVVSPLLANFFLHPFDMVMIKNDCGYVRYADDFIILGKNESDAEKFLQIAKNYISNDLKLTLKEGAKVVNVKDGFEYLGILFKDYKLLISDEKLNRLIFKIHEASKVGDGLITKKLETVVDGYRNFYCKLIPQEYLSLLDDTLITIFTNRFHELNPGKDKQREFINEVKKFDFLCAKHNFQKSEYIEGSFINNTKNEYYKKKEIPSKNLSSDNAVARRKREYQKIESEGFNLVLSMPGIAIGKREDKIIVKKNGTIFNEVQLSRLKSITIISDGVGLTSNVIEACCKYKISIDFLKNDGLPYAQLLNPEFFDAKIGICQLHSYENGKSDYLIRKFVWGKIINQKNLLKYYGKYYLKRNIAFREIFDSTIISLNEYALKVKKMTSMDLDVFRKTMFGIEGQASLSYWNTISEIICTHNFFPGRERQGAKDLINCMLNYGYGILYSRVSEAIVKAKLNPNLSYLHKPEDERPSLVYDLIEEFRQQAVDKVIISIITKCKDLKVDDGHLDERTKKLVATKVIYRLNTIEQFRNSEMRLFEIINYQAVLLSKYICGDVKSYRPYLKKW